MSIGPAVDQPRTAPALSLDYATSPPSGQRAPWHCRASLLIVAVTVLIRVGVSLLIRPVTPASLTQLPDQEEYLLPTLRMSHEGYSYYDEFFGHTMWAYRMPGYSLVLLLCHAATDPWKAQFFQAFCDAISAVAMLSIGREFGRGGVGLLAAWLVALNPFLIYFSTLLLTESLFTAILSAAVWFLVRPAPRQRIPGVLLLLLTVYVRPSAALLGVLAAALALASGLTLPRRLLTGSLAALASVGLLVLMLTPWMLRNQRELNQTIWLTTNDGFTAYDSFNPDADGSSNQRAIRQWLQQRHTTEVGRSELLSRMAWDYARTHPWRDVQLGVLKLSRFWSPVPLSADFGGKWLYVVVGGVYTVPLFVFAAVGIRRGALGGRVTLVLLLPAIYFSAVHSLAVGSLRYRVPCDVPLAVLAAAGAVSFVKPKTPVGLTT